MNPNIEEIMDVEFDLCIYIHKIKIIKSFNTNTMIFSSRKTINLPNLLFVSLRQI